MFRSLIALGILMGSLAGPSAFAFRIEQAFVSLNSSNCTLVNPSSGITAASKFATGKCDLTVAGFSNTPNCTTSIDDQANAGNARMSSSSSSSTTVRVVTVDVNSALANYNFNIVCMGD